MTHDPHDIARQALDHEMIPVPLWPRTKRPVIREWVSLTADRALAAFGQAQALADERTLTDPLNVGLVLGNGGLVDVDCDNYRALDLARVILPKTPMQHGRPSSPTAHWWYRVVDGYPLGLRKFTFPDGSAIIEYRGSGGQTMIPPSVWQSKDDPSHREVTAWEGEPFGGDAGPAEISGAQLHAAVAMIALLVLLAEEWPTSGSRHDAYLALAGGLLRDADDEGNPRAHPWWREQLPGLIAVLVDVTHDEDGAGGRIGEVVPTTVKRLADPSKKVAGWPTLARHLGPDGDALVSSIREVVAEIETALNVPRGRVTVREEDEFWEPVKPERAKDGEETPISRPEGREDSWDTQDPETAEQRGTWGLVQDHDRWLDSAHMLVSPVEAGVCWRTDGVGLLYPGRTNMFYGASDSGKSLAALGMATDFIRRGKKVLLLDLENGYDEVHERLQSLGFPRGQRTPGWGYIEAEEPLGSLQRDSWGQESVTPLGRKNRALFDSVMDDFDPDLIILDGSSTLFTMHGLDPNKITGVDTITSWLRRLNGHGKRTVLMLDHSNKNATVGDLPTGSQHKKSMVMGALLQVHGDSPEIGQTVTSSLYIIKDRPGKVKKHAFRDADGVRKAAEIVFASDPDSGRLVITFEPPDPEVMTVEAHKKKRPGRPPIDRRGDQQAILSVLRQEGVGTALSRGEVEMRVRLTMTSARVREALATLADAGAVAVVGGGRSTSYALTDLGSTYVV